MKVIVSLYASDWSEKNYSRPQIINAWFKLCSFWHFIHNYIYNLNVVNVAIKFYNFDFIFHDIIPIKLFTICYEFLVPILITFILNGLLTVLIIHGQLSPFVIASPKIVELKEFSEGLKFTTLFQIKKLRLNENVTCPKVTNYTEHFS